MKEITHFLVHVPPSIFVFYYPIIPITHSIAQWSDFEKNANVDREMCTAILSVVFGLVPTQTKYLSLVITLAFSVFLGIPLKPMRKNLLYYYL